jgi:MEMO1 family protein
MPRVTPIARDAVAQPVEMDGQVRFILQDPTGFAQGPIVAGVIVAWVLERCDGHSTVEDLQADLAREGAGMVPAGEIEKILDSLGEMGYVEGPCTEAWRLATARPAVCAGQSYPDEPSALREMLNGFFASEDGPGSAPDASGNFMRGLVAPHIDYRRGGPCYAHAYRALSRSAPADIYVILGTAHNPMPHLYTATHKHFQTPLGLAETDAEFIAALADRAHFDIFAGEAVHRAEHSIELQVLMLQYIFPDRPFRIVPVLCGSFHDLMEKKQAPADDPEVKGFIAALRATASGRSVCVIAGADLSHQGRFFEQDVDITEDFKRDLESSDRRILDALASGGAGGFYRAAAESGNRTNICSVNNIYTLCAALAPKTVRLIDYGQFHLAKEENLVTFCAMEMF